MFSFTKSALVAMTMALGIGSVAQAGSYGTSYKTVTVWVTKHIPYTINVKKYDYHGCAYWAKETRYKSIQVPVTKYVPVKSYSGGYGY